MYSSHGHIYFSISYQIKTYILFKPKMNCTLNMAILLEKAFSSQNKTFPSYQTPAALSRQNMYARYIWNICIEIKQSNNLNKAIKPIIAFSYSKYICSSYLTITIAILLERGIPNQNHAYQSHVVQTLL